MPIRYISRIFCSLKNHDSLHLRLTSHIIIKSHRSHSYACVTLLRRRSVVGWKSRFFIGQWSITIYPVYGRLLNKCWDILYTQSPAFSSVYWFHACWNQQVFQAVGFARITVCPGSYKQTVTEDGKFKFHTFWSEMQTRCSVLYRCYYA